MKRFDKTTLKGDEARLNHGDSEGWKDGAKAMRETNDAAPSLRG